MPDIIEWGVCHSVDLNWLIKGIADVPEPSGVERDLIELERLDTNLFRRIESYIKGTVDAVREYRKKKRINEE